jgi:hypothetical protein
MFVTMSSRKIITFLSSPAVTISVIVIAVAARIFLQIHFLNTDNDKSYQLQAAKNFIDGNGFTLLEASAGNIAQSSFLPLIKWPPGYSFFVSLFFVPTQDLITASILLDAVTCILFVIFSRTILTRLGVSRWLLNIYTLSTGFFLYSFSTISSSDFLALTFIVISVSLALSLFQHEALQPGKLLLLSLLLFSAGFTRYMYIPVALCLPGYFIIGGLLAKKIKLFRKALISFFIVLILNGILLSYQYFITGTATYIRDTGKGFFPESLLEMHPFLFSSFINVSFAAAQLSNETNISYENILYIIQVTHWLLVIVVVSFFIGRINRFLIKPLPCIDNYLIMGSLLSLVVIGLLSYLSITNAPFETGEKYKWTYVHEGRYFAFPVFFFQQLLFVALERYKLLGQKFIKHLLAIIALLFTIDFFHNIFYTTKSAIATGQSVCKNPHSPGLIRFVETLTRETIKQFPGKKIVFYSRPVFIGSQAAFYYPVPALYNWANKNDLAIHTDEDILLIYISNQPGSLPETLKNIRVVNKLQFDKYYFTIINILPD